MSATADVHVEKQRVEITYNGEPREFSFVETELVRTLLDRAIKEFGIVNSPHLFGLFTTAMVELDDKKTLHQEKVHPGEQLILRQSEVRGGRC